MGACISRNHVVPAPESQRDTHNGTPPSPRRGAPQASAADERAPARQDELAPVRQDGRQGEPSCEPSAHERTPPSHTPARQDGPAPVGQDEQSREPCARERTPPSHALAHTRAQESPQPGARQPLYARIGHSNPRHVRDEWRRLLDAQEPLPERARNAALDAAILRGDSLVESRVDGLGGGPGDVDAASAARAHVLSVPKRIVSLLLSSTFTDTEWERNLLIDDVVPFLQEYARKLGFEFRLSEMRWGIREEASSAHLTSEICMAELERCQRESQVLSCLFITHTCMRTQTHTHAHTRTHTHYGCT